MKEERKNKNERKKEKKEGRPHGSKTAHMKSIHYIYSGSF